MYMQICSSSLKVYISLSTGTAENNKHILLTGLDTLILNLYLIIITVNFAYVLCCTSLMIYFIINAFFLPCLHNYVLITVCILFVDILKIKHCIT